MTLRFYHHPRCSKSREALALLTERGQVPEVVRYLDAGLTVEELQQLQRALGQPVSAMIRWKEAEAQALRPDMPEAELLAAVAASPILLERPVALSGQRAVIGRPPERVLTLLEG